MPIEPTREEWIWARDRIAQRLPSTGPDRLAEAALGPCPPEPAPGPWGWRGFEVDARWAYGQSPDDPRGYVQLRARGGTHVIPVDVAERFGNALIERAQWLREHGDQS